LSLTPDERISIAVVGNIPTSRFEEGKSELGHLHLDNETGSHGFIGELSSFEVRSSSTGRSSIFHVGTLEIRATKVGSELASKRFSIDDAGRDTIKSSSSDMASELLTTTGEPVGVKTFTETESMNNFVHNADHVLFMG